VKAKVTVPTDYVSSIGNDNLRISSINSPKGNDRVVYTNVEIPGKHNNTNVNSYMPPAHLTSSENRHAEAYDEASNASVAMRYEHEIEHM
jgi:hypothetical protein